MGKLDDFDLDVKIKTTITKQGIAPASTMLSRGLCFTNACPTGPKKCSHSLINCK